MWNCARLWLRDYTYKGFPSQCIFTAAHHHASWTLSSFLVADADLKMGPKLVVNKCPRDRLAKHLTSHQIIGRNGVPVILVWQQFLSLESQPFQDQTER